MRGSLVAVLVVCAGGVGGALAVAALAQHGEVIAHCVAPADVRYNSVRYEVTVSWGGTVPRLLHGRRVWELVVHREGEPNAGHSVLLHPLGADPTSARCSFEPEGIRVAFASGHAVFVPSTSFIGGR